MSEDSAQLPPLSQLLRDAMHAKGIRGPRYIASEVNLSAEYVRRWLNGTEVPSNDYLRQLTDLLGVNYRKALKLAEARRRELILPLEAMKDPQFQLLTKLWAIMDTGQHERLFKLAVALARENKQPSEAQGAAVGANSH
jgi:transcriptional regulator with XRE-family HTH domain